MESARSTRGGKLGILLTSSLGRDRRMGRIAGVEDNQCMSNFKSDNARSQVHGKPRLQVPTKKMYKKRKRVTREQGGHLQHGF